MSNKQIIVAVTAAILVAGTTGYWWGHGARTGSSASAQDQAATSVASPGTKPVRKLRYYRNPMGLADTSPTPKKDPMGMDYVAVYEGEESAESDASGADSNSIKISTEKVQKLGVRTELAKMESLDKQVRASGRIEIDESRTYGISPKFEGYVERLYVNVTGQPVSRGQALFEVYSPELVSAQREYTIAAQGVEALKEAGGEAQGGMAQLAESSLMRLKNWDISEAQVKALAKSGTTQRTLTFRSPISGIVTEKKALQGMRFMPGESLYQIADLSAVWVVADVFEQDIGMIRNGSKAIVKINAYPDKVFQGKVSYVYPTLQAATRTVSVRIELPNPGQLLKPAMFAQVEIPVAAKGQVVTVPISAVIDSGTRQIVLVQKAEGRFEPREVKLGMRGDTSVEVREGVKVGEPVVVAANFLIDAESNLKAAVGGFGMAPAAQTASAPVVAPSAPSTKAGYTGEGAIDSVNQKTGMVTLNHDAIAALKWPAMTMEFKLANTALLQGLKPGARVTFEFVERGAGEWVVTRISPAAAMPAGMVMPTGGVMPSTPQSTSHSGH